MNTLRERRLAKLGEARLYLCTDASRGDGLADFLEAAYVGGTDIIQLRDKSLEAADEIRALEVLAQLASRHDKLFAVNDRADIAVLVGADILHLGQGDLSTEQARRIVGKDVLIGRSTHTPEQAAAAYADPGIDYFCTGPVWETPTKPGRAAVGLGLPRVAAAMAGVGPRELPFFAIGGIDAKNLPQVLETGATRIVVVRAITQADDPRTASASLRGALAHPGSRVPAR